jgi:hypothetical protein
VGWSRNVQPGRWRQVSSLAPARDVAHPEALRASTLLLVGEDYHLDETRLLSARRSGGRVDLGRLLQARGLDPAEQKNVERALHLKIRLGRVVSRDGLREERRG